MSTGPDSRCAQRDSREPGARGSFTTSGPPVSAERSANSVRKKLTEFYRSRVAAVITSYGQSRAILLTLPQGVSLRTARRLADYLEREVWHAEDYIKVWENMDVRAPSVVPNV